MGDGKTVQLFCNDAYQKKFWIEEGGKKRKEKKNRIRKNRRPF
jgi:hypothetical protein